MKKILIIALSISESICRNKILYSLMTYNKFDYPDCLIDAVIFCQGFGSTEQVGKIKFIRDDNAFNKGLSISTIRNYFINSYYDNIMKDHDYLLFIDDDTVFKPGSLKNISEMVKFMDDNPTIGIINSYHGKFDYYEPMSPMKVGTRSGILARNASKELIDFGGSYEIKYYEEAFLAMKYYLAGYDIYKTSNCVSTRTKKGSGITDRLRDKYGSTIIYSDDLVTGWTVLTNLGLYIPNERYRDHLHLGKLSDKAKDTHNRNREMLLK